MRGDTPSRKRADAPAGVAEKVVPTRPDGGKLAPCFVDRSAARVALFPDHLFAFDQVADPLREVARSVQVAPRGVRR